MSESKAVAIDADEESCRITNFEIRDPDVVRYFADADESARRRRFETALRAGVLAVESAETGEGPGADSLRSDLEEVRRSVEFLSTTRDKCEEIRETAALLGDDLDDLQDHLDGQLGAIDERLIASADD